LVGRLRIPLAASEEFPFAILLFCDYILVEAATSPIKSPAVVSNLALKEAVDKNPAAVLKYGLFLNNLIDFTIVAFSVFLIVKAVNQMQRKPMPAVAPTTTKCPECLMNIPLDAKRRGHFTTWL
jgi:large conductance mechanosensitive channel protein